MRCSPWLAYIQSWSYSYRENGISYLKLLTEAKMHCLRLEAGFPFVVRSFRSFRGPWNPSHKTSKSRSRRTASQAYHHALLAPLSSPVSRLDAGCSPNHPRACRR